MILIEEIYKWNGALAPRTLDTDYIILHHAAAVECTAQDIHRWHVAQGWVGIGYHYFVAKVGKVYRGRPYDTVGAHCTNYNNKSIGICCEGNFAIEAMPDAQKRALSELCRDVQNHYPKAKIVGHRDCTPTACPGAYFPLAEMQAAVLPAEPIVSVWAEDAWAKAAPYPMRGVLDGTNPQGPVTREMLAVVLDRLGLLK